MKIKKIDALSNKCESCGNNLIFNPEMQALFCPACKISKSIDTSDNYLKHDFDVNAPAIDANEEWKNQDKAMKCPNCGASVVLQGYEISSTCPYCDTSLISTGDKNAKIKPDGIIPFAIGPQKATELFINRIKKSKLAPNSFRKKVTADSIHSYYFPAFIYNAECNTNYSGMLYNEHTVRDSKGFTQTKRRYFRIEGTIRTLHKNIEIEASEKIGQLELLAVKPYNFDKAKQFSNDYLSGYCAECYSSSVKNTFNAANTVIKSSIRTSILKKYSYDGVSNLDMNINYLTKNYSYFMLPMYRVNFNFKNKKYSNIINGQTGKVGGKVPKSKWKISLIVIASILAFLIPIILTILLNTGV